MKQDWVDECLRLCRRKADFYCGGRKIIRGHVMTMEEIKDDLKIEDSGYTNYKMNKLTKDYFHPESHRVARELWEGRLKQRKYGSVGFTTYNHLIKSDPAKRSKRASVMGPCIQSVCLTLLNNQQTSIDVFYRTTEILKKFPADLVFIRDVLLSGFEFDLESINFHFANVTVHPMYFVTILPLLKYPIDEMERIKAKDQYFYNWLVKWAARYICPEHHRGIAKFAQAMRVYDDVHNRISKKQLTELREYFIDNHPGYRREYIAP